MEPNVPGTKLPTNTAYSGHIGTSSGAHCAVLILFVATSHAETMKRACGENPA
jgi:hypothetical protein